MTQEQKAALINAHRAASQALADARIIIHRVQHGEFNDPEVLEAEQVARRAFNEADKVFMDLVLSL